MEFLQEMVMHAYAYRLPLVLLCVSSLVLIVRRSLSAKIDHREPPVISSTIPYIGHVIGMFRHGASYFDFINKEKNYPIYTLPTLNSRTYIITSPALAAIIQRSSKSTSFYSAILEVTNRLCSFDVPTMRLLKINADRHDGKFGIMPESHDMLAGVLCPGPLLNDLTKVQLELFSETLMKLNPKADETVDLLEWLREQFTLSNARAFYGPENAFAVHPELVKDFWVFEHGMLGLLPDILPSVFARKAHSARKKLLAGLVEYIEEGRYRNASLMIQRRVAINLKHGITPQMEGHGELIMLFAIVGNAVPTSFWLLANLFSRPELLAEVRGEIEKCVTVVKDSDGKESRVIHVDMLRSVAPVLTSCFRETLRMVANLTSVRWVTEDLMIDKYLLKKNSMVQVASGVIHMNEDVWGQDAGEFDPRRFASTMENTSLPKNVPSAAFRAFGGGSVLCPGRHFAQSEIVGFVAGVVMGFDFEKAGGGLIELPKRDNTVIPLAVMKPTEECRVTITRRKGLEDVKWELKI